VEWVLLDWTRMGRAYCLAGAVVGQEGVRIVRPLPERWRAAGDRKIGWSPFLLDGRQRWEVFQLLEPRQASPEPPHLEDVWVRALRPCRRQASPEERRHILRATQTPEGQPLFGAPLTRLTASAYVAAGTGERSLATAVLAANELHFSAVWRSGMDEADYRVQLSAGEAAGLSLPVKDHFLLARAEREAEDLEGRLAALSRAVQAMGPRVAVRLGVSRAFPTAEAAKAAACWLMADGFFSLDDPQP
jgi:hypothetical protein